MGDNGPSNAQLLQSRKAAPQLQNEFYRRKPLIRAEIEVYGRKFFGFVEEGTRLNKGIASITRGYGGGIGIIYNEKIKADELAVLVVDGEILVKGGIDPAKVIWDGVSQGDRALAMEYSKQSKGGLHFGTNGGIPVLVEGDGNLVFPNGDEMKITKSTSKIYVYMQEGGPDLQTKEDLNSYYDKNNEKTPEKHAHIERKKTFVESASLRDTEIEVDESKLKIMDTDTGELIGLKDWNRKIEGFKYGDINVRDIFIKEIELSKVTVEQHVPILFGNESVQVISDFNFRHRSVRVISADDYVLNHIAYTQNPAETGQIGTEIQSVTAQQRIDTMQQAVQLAPQQADFLVPNPSHDIYDGNPRLTRPVINAFNDGMAYTPNPQEIPASSERNHNREVAEIPGYDYTRYERKQAVTTDEIKMETAGEKKRRKRRPVVLLYAPKIESSAKQKRTKSEESIYPAQKSTATKRKKLRERIKDMKPQVEDKIVKFCPHWKLSNFQYKDKIAKKQNVKKKKTKNMESIELPKEPKGKKKKAQEFLKEKREEKEAKTRKKRKKLQASGKPGPEVKIKAKTEMKKDEKRGKKTAEGLKGRKKPEKSEKIKIKEKKTLKKPQETKKEKIPKEPEKQKPKCEKKEMRKKKVVDSRKPISRSLLLMLINGQRSRARNSARRLSR